MFQIKGATCLVAFWLAFSGVLQTRVGAADAPVRPAREELSIPARLLILCNRNAAHPMDRTKQALALGRLSDPREVRDQQVVDALCRIATDSTDDLFVRMECIQALGELQFNVFADDYVRAQYAVPFVSILKDTREDELVRTKAVQVLGRTLPLEQPQTQVAVVAMGSMAGDRNGSLLLRVACVDALAEIGAASELIDLVVTVLPQTNLDPLLQERMIKAFGEVLARVANLKPLPLPTLIRIKDLTMNPATPVELRVVGLRALARLKKAGLSKSVNLMPEIRRILREADDARLLIAAVEVVGILDEADAIPLLRETYTDFFDAEKATREADVKIRTQIVRTLGGLVCAQASTKRPDAEAIRQAAALYLEIVNPVQENLEPAPIREDVIFALRYLYPKRPEFQRFHQPVIERLLAVAKEGQKEGAEIPDAIAETLTIISRYPGGRELQRWEKWYAKTYPGTEVVKAGNP